MSRPDPTSPTVETASALACGLLWAITLTKLGNPVVLDHLITPPQGALELLFNPWPIGWGYILMLLTLPAAFVIANTKSSAPILIRTLPLAWLAWQLLSASLSIDPSKSWKTTTHLAACTTSFYVGLHALSQLRRTQIHWILLIIAFWWVLLSGFDQHYGGLDASRKMILDQQSPHNLPPEFLKRLESNRVFGTLFYPNALAGVILLLLPTTVFLSWKHCFPNVRILRASATGALAYAGLACLFWSGSKAGWLIAVLVTAISLTRFSTHKAWKIAIPTAIAIAGVTIFAIRFSQYFERGATSLVARFDYWKVASVIAIEHPVLGSGPGTFGALYARMKHPDSEMARLTHNDYLQQASDSGILSALLYLTWIGWSSIQLYRRSQPATLQFFLAIGLLAWALHSLVEFPLYIPASAWIAFSLLGWLWNSSPIIPVDIQKPNP